MKKIDSDYYRARITAEESAARDAATPEAARRHQQLVERYAGMLAADGPADPADGGPAA